MVEIDAHYWRKELQPKIAKEAGWNWQSIDSYLNAAGHDFIDSWGPNYRFRIWFNDPKDEVIFRLRYDIK